MLKYPVIAILLCAPLIHGVAVAAETAMAMPEASDSLLATTAGDADGVSAGPLQAAPDSPVHNAADSPAASSDDTHVDNHAHTASRAAVATPRANAGTSRTALGSDAASAHATPPARKPASAVPWQSLLPGVMK